MLLLSSVNEVSLLVAALLAVAVGSVWYSPHFFGAVLEQSMTESLRARLSTRQGVMVSAAQSVALFFIFYGILAHLLEYVNMETMTFSGRLLYIFLLVLFLSLASLVHTLSEGRSLKAWTAWVGYMTWVCVGGMCIITLWPW